MNRNLLYLVLWMILQFGCAQEKKVAYLVAYMKGDDEKHMYYALAHHNSFVFEELNGGKPIIAASFDDRLIRDPMILKDKNGVYRLVATVSWSNRPFTIWDSDDLITWKNERLVDIAPIGATKTWAPEFAYDEEHDIYIVHWTAELDNDWNTAAIYYATTHDFIQFSEPAVLYRSPHNVGILDANIIKVDDVYYLIYREDGIWAVSSKHAQGPYNNPYKLTDENVEGPFVFPLNTNDGYGIVWDHFGRSSGFSLLLADKQLADWTRITNPTAPFYNSNVQFPKGIRHGSILGLTQREVDQLYQSGLME